MSSFFSVCPQKAKRYKTEAEAVHKSWVSCNNEMDSVLNSLGTYSGYANVKRRLRELCNSSSQDADSMRRYIRAIEEIIKKYEDTERRICNGTVVDELKWESLIPSEQYTMEDLEVDASWWDQFKEFTEGIYTGIPEWLRLLLMTNPATMPIALVSYILENDYLRTAYWKAIGGDFEDDTNALGVALSVVIGCLPVIGTIADVRDFIADIYNLIYDGPKTSEWINLAFTTAGFIPLAGDLLKHGDEAGDVLKGIFRSANAAGRIDDIADGAKHAGDFISTVVEKVDDFKGALNQRTIAKLTDPIKDALKEKLPDQVVNVLRRSINEGDTVGDLLKNLSLGEFNNTTGIPTDLKTLLKTLFPDSNHTDMQQHAGGGASRTADSFAGITHANSGFCSAFA